MRMVVTAVNSITSVGLTAAATACAIRAGVSGFTLSDEYLDDDENEIIVSEIEGASDNSDANARLADVAELCMNGLLESWNMNQRHLPTAVHLFLGTATSKRPGPDYAALLGQSLIHNLNELGLKNVELIVVPSGNAGVHHALVKASKLLATDPNSICIIGGMDSLLAEETIDWLEEEQRLKSETFGRQQSIIPGEAVGFFVVEAKSRISNEGAMALVEIVGLGLAVEPSPRLSPEPSRGIGLTDACRGALNSAGYEPSYIDTVVCDLDGEFFRAKQWSYAEIRSLGNSNENRELWHPADCLGTIGAASAAVYVCLLAEARGWLSGTTLMVCMDDEGACGAAVIRS